MATKTKTPTRINVALPEDLLAEFKALVPARKRNQFMVDLVQRELRRLRALKALEESFGAWSAEDHPDLKTAEDIDLYVRRLRESWMPRSWDAIAEENSEHDKVFAGHEHFDQHLRGDRPFNDLVSELIRTGEVYISTVTRVEILAGMRPHEETFTITLLDSLVNMPVAVNIADQAGRWIYQYARRGLHLAFPDALIAATAFQHELTLVTTNAKHFPMPELQLRDI